MLKIRKRVIAAMLSALMVFSIVPLDALGVVLDEIFYVNNGWTGSLKNGVPFEVAPNIQMDGYFASLSTVAPESIPISTRADLEGLHNRSGTFHLANNIDLSGAVWIPINNFSGTLNGNGHMITGLHIYSVNMPAKGRIWSGGLFGHIHNANVTIENLGIVHNGITVTDVNAFSGDRTFNVGGMVGLFDGNGTLTIRNSFVRGSLIRVAARSSALSGNVRCYAFVGGLVGRAGSNVVIENSFVISDVEARATAMTSGWFSSGTARVHVGRLIGRADGSATIRHVYALGSVTAHAGAMGGTGGRNVSVDAGDLVGSARTAVHANFAFRVGSWSPSISMSGTVGSERRLQLAAQVTHAELRNNLNSGAWAVSPQHNNHYPVLRIFHNPTVSVGSQTGALTAGTAGSAAFTVTSDFIMYPLLSVAINGAPIGVTSAQILMPGTLAINATAVTPAGTHPLTITIVDAANRTATSSVFNLVIERASPTLTLSAYPQNTQTFPGNVTLTAALTGAHQSAVGQMIRFEVNGVSFEEPVNSDGIATHIVAMPTPGIHSFQAYFSGDANNNAVTSMPIANYTVTRANQTEVNIRGLNLNYTYGVAPFRLSLEGGLGSGIVTFVSDNPTVASISGATVTIHRVGTFSITATRAGDAHFDYASITSEVVTVSPATPNVSLTVSGDAAFVTLTASVTADSISTIPEGVVEFWDGDTLMGIQSLVGGTAVLSVASANAVTRTFKAVYSGQSGFFSTGSDIKMHNVDMAIQSPLFITGAPSVNTYGDGGFVLATSGGNGVGAVTFSVPHNNGVLDITTGGIVTIIGVGTTTVTVRKSSDGTFNEASSNLQITVSPRCITNVTVAITGSRTYVGGPIRPIFTVTDGTIAITSGDFTHDYGINLNVGVNGGSITLFGQRNYTGTKTVEFDIEQRPLTGAIITLERASFPLTGSEISPNVRSVVVDGIVVPPAAYDVTYSNNVNIGTATATITARLDSNFSGTANTEFQITKLDGANVSGPPTARVVTSTTITVNAVMNVGATGQAVEYAISTDNSTTPITGWQSGTTFSGLVTGTVYYVFARTAETATHFAGIAQMSTGIAAITAVTGITGVPSPVEAGSSLVLTGRVAPDDATNREIIWEVAYAGTTRATIADGNILNVVYDGMVRIRATIVDGRGIGVDFIQYFSVTSADQVVYISSAAELASIGGPQSEGVHFVMTNDIDLSGFNNGSWIPINDFRGTLNGNGFRVYNLNITRGYHPFVGLFGNIRQGDVTIRNLGVHIGSQGITSTWLAGGTVLDERHTSVGGLVGVVSLNANVTIDRSYVTGGIIKAIAVETSSSGPTATAGGFIGLVAGESRVIITDSYVRSVVFARAECGIAWALFNDGATLISLFFGIIGDVPQGLSCVVEIAGWGLGAVTIPSATAFAAGMVGFVDGTAHIDIERSYSVSAVETRNRSVSTFSNYFAEASPGVAGRLIPHYLNRQRRISDSFFGNEETIIARTTYSVGYGRTREEMRREATFEGFTFDEYNWGIGENASYPYLRIFNWINPVTTFVIHGFPYGFSRCNGASESLVHVTVKDAALFSHVYVNGTRLRINEHFSVESGSTRIALFADFLDTLPDGIHTLSVYFTDGYIIEDLFITEGQRANELANLDLSQIVEIHINNVPLTPELHFNEETFAIHESHILSLPEGRHILTIIFSDGNVVETDFIIDRSGNQRPSAPGGVAVSQGDWQEAISTPIPEQVPLSNHRTASDLFDDVALGRWYYDYVTIAATQNLFQGTAPRIFNPQANMTRAMFAQVLANMENADLTAYAGTSASFNDAAQGRWYFTAVQWAANAGLIQGVGNGRFAPDDYITREQMAVMLHRFAEMRGIVLPREDIDQFIDYAEKSPWAAEAVDTKAAAGIIRGRPNGRFDPQATATRAEVAAIFARLLAPIQ